MVVLCDTNFSQANKPIFQVHFFPLSVLPQALYFLQPLRISLSDVNAKLLTFLQLSEEVLELDSCLFFWILSCFFSHLHRPHDSTENYSKQQTYLEFLHSKYWLKLKAIKHIYIEITNMGISPILVYIMYGNFSHEGIDMTPGSQILTRVR